MDWDFRYRQHGRVFGDVPTPFLEEQFPALESDLPKPSSILCPGDGYGRNGLWLARRGHRVKAIDLSSVAVEMANEAARAEGLHYESAVADMADMTNDLGGLFDCIVHMWCRLPERDDRVAWNALACSWLSGGGQVILVTSHKLTTPESEMSEWPPMVWRDLSTDDEVRLVGGKAGMGD